MLNVLWVLGAVGVLRLAELIYSRLRLAADVRAGQAQALPEPGFRWMVAVHLAWFAACAAEGLWRSAAESSSVPPALFWPALVVWLGALALRVWMFAALGRWWNVKLVRRAGQPVITRGPYRFARHPNYLAVIAEIAAVPLLLGAWGTALVGSLLNAWVLWGRIRAEEAYLFEQPGYRAAFAHKKRFLPGLF